MTRSWPRVMGVWRHQWTQRGWGWGSPLAVTWKRGEVKWCWLCVTARPDHWLTDVIQVRRPAAGPWRSDVIPWTERTSFIAVIFTSLGCLRINTIVTYLQLKRSTPCILYYPGWITNCSWQTGAKIVCVPKIYVSYTQHWSIILTDFKRDLRRVLIMRPCLEEGFKICLEIFFVPVLSISVLYF